MSKLFGYKELVSCLIKLGFKKHKIYSSSHQKYDAPSSCTVTTGQRPFITAVFCRKPYSKHTCSGYMSQLRKMGYTDDEIESNL